MDIKLFETSAKENINVEEMFRAVTELVLKSKQDQLQRLNNQSDMNKHESGIKLTGSQRPGPHKANKNKNGSCCKWWSPLLPISFCQFFVSFQVLLQFLTRVKFCAKSYNGLLNLQFLFFVIFITSNWGFVYWIKIGITPVSRDQRLFLKTFMQ